MSVPMARKTEGPPDPTSPAEALAIQERHDELVRRFAPDWERRHPNGTLSFAGDYAEIRIRDEAGQCVERISTETTIVARPLPNPYSHLKFGPTGHEMARRELNRTLTRPGRAARTSRAPRRQTRPVRRAIASATSAIRSPGSPESPDSSGEPEPPWSRRSYVVAGVALVVVSLAVDVLEWWTA